MRLAVLRRGLWLGHAVLKGSAGYLVLIVGSEDEEKVAQVDEEVRQRGGVHHPHQPDVSGEEGLDDDTYQGRGEEDIRPSHLPLPMVTAIRDTRYSAANCTSREKMSEMATATLSLPVARSTISTAMATPVNTSSEGRTMVTAFLVNLKPMARNP